MSRRGKVTECLSCPLRSLWIMGHSLLTRIFRCMVREIAEDMLRGGGDEYGCGAVIEGRWCLVKSDGEQCTGCGC